MKRCAFLSMDNLAGFVNDDNLAQKPLQDMGWEIDVISWRQRNVDWDQYDAVVIRSTWDYFRDPQAFLGILEEINRSQAQLENNLDLVKWNINKNYLQKLQREGIEIVPTIYDLGFNQQKIAGYKNVFVSDELVIKPTISVNATDTFRLNSKSSTPLLSVIETTFHDKSYLVQPLMKNIIKEGEYSLFFFNGKFSHAILKAPEKHDFRVQEEHGGTIQSIQAEPSLLDSAKKVMAVITPTPLYARIDLVRTTSSQFAVMEVELIEPSLYLRMDSEAPMRFAKALDDRMK